MNNERNSDAGIGRDSDAHIESKNQVVPTADSMSTRPMQRSSCSYASRCCQHPPACCSFVSSGFCFREGTTPCAYEVSRTKEGCHLSRESSCETQEHEVPGSSVFRRTKEPAIFVRTFGYFDIFVDGKPVVFKSAKEKELVALLVDRGGGTVTAEEAISCLWEDESISDRTMGRYRKLCQRTRKTLEAQGLTGLIEESRGVRSLNRGMVTCDYYEMMAGSERYTHMFGGRYLSSYSWAEPTLAMILRMLLRRSGKNKEASLY